jgi:iron complex outermembrane recepter protein
VIKNNLVRRAVAAVLSGCAAAAAHAADAGAAGPAAPAEAAAESGGLAEVVVTAERRSESVQNVPITIQAITGDQLQQMQVETFDDILKYLPNVTFSSNGPGNGNIYMRGLSAGFAGNQSSAAIAPFPNVALYLDDQSMSFPSAAAPRPAQCATSPTSRS